MTKPSLKRLLWAGPATMVVAVVVNQIIRAIASALLQPHPNFLPLSLGPVAFLTIAGTLGAVIVFALFVQFGKQPIRTFQIVSVLALLASFIPDVLLLIGPRPASGVTPPAGGPPPMEGVTLPNVLAAMTLHVAAWAVCVILLPRLTREPVAK